MTSNAQRVRAVYEAFGRGDLGPLTEVLDEDVEWIEPDGAPGVGGVYHGRESVFAEMFGRLPGVWDEFRVAPSTYIDAGEHVVVLGELSAVDPASGTPARAPFAHVWRFEDGQAVWWRCFEDTAVLQGARTGS
ncbi:MAG: nuclear transport factor 2 family protein [Thermoleophilia bacterium]